MRTISNTCLSDCIIRTGGSKKKYEYQIVHSETSFEVLLTESVQINQVDDVKYLRSTITRQTLGKQERILKRKGIINRLSFLLYPK